MGRTKRKISRTIDLVVDKWEKNKLELIAQVLLPIHTISYALSREGRIMNHHGWVSRLDDYSPKVFTDLAKITVYTGMYYLLKK